MQRSRSSASFTRPGEMDDAGAAAASTSTSEETAALSASAKGTSLFKLGKGYALRTALAVQGAVAGRAWAGWLLLGALVLVAGLVLAVRFLLLSTGATNELSGTLVSAELTCEAWLRTYAETPSALYQERYRLAAGRE